MSEYSLTERELFFRHLALTSLHPPAKQFAHGSGIYLYTPEGETFTDLSSGYSVCNLGHSHPEVIHAIREQAGKYLHQTVYGEFIQSPQVALAAILTRLLPDLLDCVYLVNSGSEAIEGAVKLAKRYTGRHRLASFRKAYHGSTHGALTLMGDEQLKNPFRPLLPGRVELRFNQFEDLERIDETLACVVVEPVQAEAGVVLPRKGFLNALKERCHKTGTLLVFDEIQTGMGRTGPLFAFEATGVVPDILCLAKALGAGLPLGAFIASKEMMDTLATEPALGHITTFGGNPLSAAAAIAGLKALQKETNAGDIRRKAETLLEGLISYPAIREIRAAGLLIAIEFRQKDMAENALNKMWEQNLISDRFLFCEEALRISPPLIITHEQCREVNQRLKNIISSL